MTQDVVRFVKMLPGQTDEKTPNDGIGRAYVWRRAAIKCYSWFDVTVYLSVLYLIVFF